MPDSKECEVAYAGLKMLLEDIEDGHRDILGCVATMKHDGADPGELERARTHVEFIQHCCEMWVMELDREEATT